MKNSSQEDRIYSEQISKLERDLQVIKNEKMQNEEMYEKSVADLKGSLRDARRVESAKVWREEDLKKKLKAVEKLLDNAHPDLAMERGRIVKEADREKKEMMSKN